MIVTDPLIKQTVDILHKEGQVKLFRIVSEDESLEMTFAPELGGTGVSLKHHSREMLYLRESFGHSNKKDLHGGWPFLFPVCARLERAAKQGIYAYHGQLFELPIHGFSPYVPWDVIGYDDDRLEMQLTHTQETLKHYPFHFTVCLDYQVSKNELLCKQTFINCDTKPMPYYAGFHPYFRVDDKAHTKLSYKPVKRLKYNERLTDIIGEQPLFPLPSTLDNPAINEQLTRLGQEKKVCLQYPEGLRLEMQAEGVEDPNLYSYLQLYTRANEPFFCIEPWMSFPNAMNAVSGVRWLLPGQAEHGLLTLRFL